MFTNDPTDRRSAGGSRNRNVCAAFSVTATVQENISVANNCGIRDKAREDMRPHTNPASAGVHPNSLLPCPAQSRLLSPTP